MGAYSSSHLTPEEIGELEESTHFSSKEIEQLYHRFKKLDRSRTGVISRLDFQLISELSLNPMSQRLLSLFQTSSGDSALATSGGVTFDCFVRTLDYFHHSTPKETKLRALFKAYDADGDGRVSERDLRTLLRMYVGPHLSEAAIRVLCRNTMTHALARCSAAAGGDAAESKLPAAASPPSSAADCLLPGLPLPLRNNNSAELLSLTNSTSTSDSAPGDDASSSDESQGRALTFEQFAQVIGLDALEAMHVDVPIRE